MKRAILSAGLFFISVVPLPALALTYTDVSDRYSDAPFARSEAAGISILTSIDAVEGNPDGTFAASRTLNRAEFVKIASISARLLDMEPSDCFPDVKQEDWFSAYVCAAKAHEVVQGYPDGRFHPERNVNYAEALKILYQLHWGDQRELVPAAGEEWYEPFADWAGTEGVDLPGNLAFDVSLTRGQMARLAAAFRAHADGELDLYRAFERGRAISSSSPASFVSSSASDVASSSSSLSSSSFSSVASSSSSASSVFPAYNSLLIPGEQSFPLMDGLFVSTDEDGVLSGADVKFVRQVKSISKLMIIDQTGRELAEFKLIDDSEDNKWRADIGESLAPYRLPKGTPVRLGIRAVMKTIVDGGGSAETMEPRTMSIRIREVTSGISREVIPTETHLPSHQTAFGRITGMKNTLATSMSVQEGQRKMLASFAFSARAITGSTVRLKGLTFALQTSDVSVSYMRIGGSAEIQQAECSVQQGDQVLIFCPIIPEEWTVASGTPVTLSLYGDLALMGNATAGSMQIRTIGSGMIGQEGTIRWTDNLSNFNWVEQNVLLEHGPVMTVTK